MSVLPPVGTLSSLIGVRSPVGVGAISYRGNKLINWIADGDFSSTSHTLLSEPVKNDFNEYVLTTDKGKFTFVTEEVEKLRGGQFEGPKKGDIRGWGYRFYNSETGLGDYLIVGGYNNTPGLLKAVDYCDELTIPGNSHATFALQDRAVLASVLLIRNNKKIYANNSHWYLLNTNSLTHFSFIHFKARGEHARIYDLNLVGDRKVNKSGAEWGYGFLTRAYKNLELVRCTAREFHGDGFITAMDTSYPGKTNEHITLNECRAWNNGRQGLSIIGGQVTVINNEFDFTNGTDPMSGIDIEPEPNMPADLDVKIIGSTFRNNNGAGILIALQHAFVAPLLEGKTVVDINIVIDSPYILENRTRGYKTDTALRIVSGPIDYDKAVLTNRLVGKITINNYNIIRPAYGAIAIDDHYSECVPIFLNNGYIEDICHYLQPGEEIPSAGLVKFGFRSGKMPLSPNYKQGRVVINGLTYHDSQGTTFSPTATYNNHRVKRPFLNMSDKPMTNVSEWLMVRDFKTNIRLADGPYLFWRMYGARYEGKNLEVPMTGSLFGNDAYNYGEGVNIILMPIVPGTSQDMTLPLAENMIDSTVHFIMRHGSTAQIVFRGNSGDKIRTPAGTLVDSVTTTEARGLHQFYCLTNGLWVQL
ncbi:hypothetical protein [Klebsiella sp. BIGb0407]|uniref:hypothetical protein n=1 Tax=Klebsiella sp. BIGb0407 TaxID=2940603 RepID=UPI002166EA37|nr:hypothetical protein [Klebsiella sp. BIGb0407]MCS3430509.1 hypothetical protein [Klebsiella sp. BIGb0407]